MQNTTPKQSKGYFWPCLVIGLLLMQIGICTAAIISAKHSDSYIIVDQQHQNKLSWDEQQNMKDTLANLGWQLEFDIPVYNTPSQRRVVSLFIKNKDNSPVTGLHVDLKIYHHAVASQIIQGELKETQPGQYTAAMPITKEGLWELQYTLTSTEDEIIGTHTYRVSTAN